MFWGWLLIKAGCTSGPHGWLSGCSHMTTAAELLDFQGKVTLQGRSRQRACFWSSKFSFFPQQHLAVCFSYFHKLKPFWWLGQAMTHHKQDLCCFKCPVLLMRLRRITWLGPDVSPHTLLSSCLMHFRGNKNMNHFLVNIVIKYIKAYMSDWF